MVEEGAITAEQLKRALKVQALLEQPKHLGAVLIELGYATRQAISEAVARIGSTLRLGDILVEQGLISPESLQAALNAQKGQNKPLGRVLVEMGFINERTLLQSLAHQARVQYIEPSFAMVNTEVLTGVTPDYLTKLQFLPFCRTEDGKTVVVVSDLQASAVIQAIEDLFHGNHQLALGPQDAIKRSIEDFQSFRVDKPKTGKTVTAGEDNSIVQLVEHIFSQAVTERASDIHIEPMADRIRLRFRLDGVLVFKSDLPKDLLTKMASRIKILAECNITEHQRHQGGRLAFQKDGADYDMRLSSYVTVHGENMVLRVLNKQVGLVGLDELGMSPGMLERFRTDVLELPTGIVLITGPTGSGKTTTLYSSLDYCNEADRKIITVEDPVEYLIDGIIQCSVYDKVGRTFETSLREIVRQDPDIIVLGEIRDRTTVETAIQAALTGHKVYSTFHTEDTIGGLVRLLNMEIEAFLISSTVISVVAQRLLRRICPMCVTPYVPSPLDIRRLGLDQQEINAYEYKKGQGCPNCHYTGYKGRVGAYELLVVNDAVKEAILERKPAHIIRQISCDTTGLISMREDAVAKVVRGFTTFDEVLKHTPKTVQMRGLRQILNMTQ